MAQYRDLWQRTNAALESLRAGIGQLYAKINVGTIKTEEQSPVEYTTVTVDGVEYLVVGVVDSQGGTISPADVESIRELGTELSCSLLRIIELLEEAVSE